MTEKELIRPFIKHDDNASQDSKVLKLCFDFHKTAKKMTREELESFVSHGAYAIFWRILEFMHTNNLYINSNDIDVLSDNFRIDTKYIRQILENYNLFKVVENKFISDRLLRDFDRQKEKAEQAKKAISTRWQLATLKKWYNKIFGTDYTLSKPQQKVYIEYANSIKDFEKKLPDILFTLKKLRFDNNKDFVPSIDWLLQDTNLTKMLNGGFGEIKSWSTYQERLKAKEKEDALKERELQEDIFDINTVSSKPDAVDLIMQHSTYVNLTKTLHIQTEYKGLIKKFDLPMKELIKEKLRRNTS